MQISVDGKEHVEFHRPPVGQISCQYTVRCAECHTALTYPAIDPEDAAQRLRHWGWRQWGVTHFWRCPDCADSVPGALDREE